MKAKTSWSIDKEVLELLKEYKEKKYPGLSTSAVVEILLREGLPNPKISVA